MKKLLVLILLVTMLLPAIGIAEFDLKSMTDEQLRLLNKEIVAEAISREKTAFIPIGRYIIGVDIPEGEYEITLDPNASHNSTYYVYEESNRRLIISGGISKELSPDSRAILKNGNILEIHYADVYMKKSYRIIEFK